MRLAGGPTTVSEEVVLPAQPAAGSVEFVPLGGDGMRAPRAAYAIKGFALTGDASSGRVEHKITMDPRYTAIVSFVSLNISQGTSADADFVLTISGARSPQLNDAGVITAVASLIDSVEARHTWNPPALTLPGGTESASITAKVLNVLADVSRLEAWIYLFDIDVRQKTPMGPLLWARGST